MLNFCDDFLKTVTILSRFAFYYACSYQKMFAYTADDEKFGRRRLLVA